MEGIRLDLVLFPGEPVVDDVALAVFLEQDGTLRPWRFPAERLRAAPTGSLKLELRARDLGLVPGPAVLWLAVSRPCCLPEVEQARERSRGKETTGSKDVRWMRLELLLELPPSELPTGDAGLLPFP